MKILKILSLSLVFVLGCSSHKKGGTAPNKEPPVTRAKPEVKPSPPAEKKVTPPPAEPAIVIKDKGGLTDQEIETVKTITKAFITKVINSKADLLVDKMAKKLGRDTFIKSWPFFVKGALKSFTAVGVSLVVNTVVKKMGKKLTQEIIDRIVKPMIEQAAKKAMDNAYKNFLGAK